MSIVRVVGWLCGKDIMIPQWFSAHKSCAVKTPGQSNICQQLHKAFTGVMGSRIVLDSFSRPRQTHQSDRNCLIYSPLPAQEQHAQGLDRTKSNTFKRDEIHQPFRLELLVLSSNYMKEKTRDVEFYRSVGQMLLSISVRACRSLFDPSEQSQNTKQTKLNTFLYSSSFRMSAPAVQAVSAC